MTTISLLTPVSYVRPRSYTEGVLSTLSHFFYLGGNRVKIFRNDEVRLESQKISWRILTIKVASYVLLFPLTVTLFAIYAGLRYHHYFTVISPSPKHKNEFQKPEQRSASPLTQKRKEVSKNFSTILSEDKAQVIYPMLSTQKMDKEPFLEVYPKPKESLRSELIVTASNVESVVQQAACISDATRPAERSPPSPLALDEISLMQTKTILSHNEQNEHPLLDDEAEILSLEEFRDMLKYFDIYDENLEDLFEKAPKTLELTDIVNLIFEECSKEDITLLLDEILISYPSYSLSPHDKIRKAIVEDEGHILNNSSLIALFKQHSLEANEEKLNKCYNLAYRLNHPYIYRLFRKPILSSDYNLNFLWVNLNPQDRIEDTAQNIFGDGLDLSENAECIKDPKTLRTFEENEEALEKEILENWKKIKKSFGYQISRWADFNPGAQINLWYDSALVTQKAQQKTFEMMKSISVSRGVDLKLKDIRQLPNIGGEIGNSLHPGTQVYFRVDLLKALIADHMMVSEESPKYCVISDIDVQPMPPEQIFDQRTIDYLSSAGYVFNRAGWLDDFENSFFIFNTENKYLKKVHCKTIIKRTAANITSLRQFSIGTTLRPDNILNSQFVFKQYSNFRTRMKENGDEFKTPRKVVKCPKSQFNSGGNFSDSDYQAEEFRFIGDSNIPYTKNGRNYNNDEGQIEELIKWKAQPLSLVD